MLYTIAKIFSYVLLLGPVALFLLSLLCTWIPGAANILSTFFLETLGNFKLFALASQALQIGMSHENFSGDNFIFWFLSILLDAMLEALVMGCCVFIVKRANMRFSRKGRALYSHPIWQLTLMGIIVGIIVCQVLALLVPAVERLISVGIYIGCLIYGFSLMLGAGSRRYSNRKWGYLTTLLLDLLCNMVNAIGGVLIITCLLEGPRYMKAGGSVKIWILWIVMSIAVIYLMHLLTKFLEPDDV